MIKKVVQYENQSKVYTIIASILAFLSGLAGVAALLNFYPIVFAWITAILAFISAILGSISIVIDKRKNDLEAFLQKTKPTLDADIKTSEPSMNLVVVITSINKIPFEFDVKVLTKNNRIVTGLMLEWAKYYPSDEEKYVTYNIGINFKQVIDQYLELHFQFRSIHFAEFKDLDLSGIIIKKYVLSPDNLYCFPIQDS